MTSVTKTLERLGEIEWYAIRPAALVTNSDLPTFPPMITLRYKGGNARPFQRLSECLRSYEGKTKWIVVGAKKKNLCLMPEKVYEISSRTGQGTLDVVQHLIRTNPTFVRDAVNDFETLVLHSSASL